MQSSIYLLSEGINKTIPFIILPIISYFLSPEEYGTLTNYNVITQILAVFCYSVTTVIIPVMYVKLRQDEIKVFISNIVFFNTMIALVLFIFSFVIKDKINIITGIEFRFQVIASASILFSSFTQVNMVMWRCEEKPISFGIYQISQTIIDLCLSLVLIIIYVMGWKGRVYSMAFSSIFLGIFSLILLAKRGFINSKISKANILTIFSFSIPLLPHGLSFWIKSGADKLLLTNMCGLESNGLYSVAVTFGGIISIIVVSFNNGFVPYLFKKLKHIEAIKDTLIQNDAKIQLVKMYRYLLMGLFLIVLACYLGAYVFITYVYPLNYRGALLYLPFIVSGQLFLGIYSLFVNFIHYMQKTKVLGTITFTLTIFQIILSYLLINLLGPIGSAVSSAIIAFVIFASVTLYALRIYKLPWMYLLK